MIRDTQLDPSSGFPGVTVVKNLPANAGDARDSGLILGLGRSPDIGNGNPLEYFCLENSIFLEKSSSQEGPAGL